MFKVARERRLLMWTMLLIAIVQMPHIALMPAIDLIQSNVFPDKSVATIQTVMSLPNLISIFSGVFSAFLISRGILSKKTVVLLGISLVGLTGVVAIIMHSQFWQLCSFSVVLGCGLGLYIPNTQSIMADSFPEDERQMLTGLQFAFVNVGGILMSVFGGMLTTPSRWYGGYIMLLMVIPVLLLAISALPKGRAVSVRDSKTTANTKLPSDVFYYAATVLIFLLLYNVSNSNISTHLADFGLGDTSTSGVVSATMMAGGVISGFVFPKISPKFGDYSISVGFAMMTITYTIMNIFASSLVMVYIAMLVTGMTLSMIMPQCIFKISNVVDESNSATAMMLSSCIASGLGGFLSPVVFTNITTLFSDSTAFRFQFTAFVALALTVFYTISTKRRKA